MNDISVFGAGAFGTALAIVLAKAGNTFVVPANLGDLTSMMALATDIVKGNKSAPEA